MWYKYDADQTFPLCSEESSELKGNKSKGCAESFTLELHKEFSFLVFKLLSDPLWFQTVYKSQKFKFTVSLNLTHLPISTREA